MKHYKIGFVALGMMTMVSCGGDEPTVDPDTTIGTLDDTTAVETNNDFTEVGPMYGVPTPDELFNLIKGAGSEPALEVLNSPDNVQNYVNNKSKALNFGVYSTDLAYSSSHDAGVATLKYYSSVKQLGDDLGISAAYTTAMQERIEENLDSGDSLLNISKDTYYNAYDYLEQNDRGPTLALVITGGWIESMFIVTNLIDGYSADNPTIERLAEQKLTLENLLEFLTKYESDEAVKSTIADLGELKTIFEGLEEVEVESATEGNGGRVALGGTPKKLTMTEDQYNELTGKIVALRNGITGGNQ